MKKILKWVFPYLLLAFHLSSCNNSSFNKLIGRSGASSYTIDVSEGKTEIEKTLIVKYNNAIESLLILEKNKKDEKLTTDDEYKYQRIIDDFIRFTENNIYNVRNELVDRIITNSTNLKSAVETVGSNNPVNETYKPEPETIVEYIEKKVDLNDYLNSSTGWDDGTDWNCTGFEDPEGMAVFDEALKKNGIYWSDAKGSYVIKVKRTTFRNVPKNDSHK